MLIMSLIIIGCAIILWGVAAAVLIYRARQGYIDGLSEKYLSKFSDNDIIPPEITLRVFRSLITRVIIVVFAIMFVEIAGFALLVVSQVI